MLDNMSPPEDMSKRLKLIGGRALTECSGNINKGKISKAL